ncbi:glucosyltransferase domain-containing protein [Flavobacterium cyclinae]|uniref:glucosyltransferase domain-containing protein n=1 Tax=Flavobacterium cyclinae TaxID=2895947 RepID=UPI001E3AA4F7|nr:glucosyltransferase domain-containing protein [Flavobacterium cyclinae]UGS21113.1 glucosyltransferase domain-containing protein [Flavobacterium cyclinae]
MNNLLNKGFEKDIKMYFFTFFLSLVAYGFALSNYTLSVDNEIPILSDFALDMGRWGQNLIRYHLFNGHLQYFTLILGLFFFSVSAVRLSKLFKFENIYAYFFCGLFITIPQISYQVVFYMMSDIAGLGVLLSVISVEIFIKNIENSSKIKLFFYLLLASLIIMFATSMYQILILFPVTIYVIHFFQKLHNEDFNQKKEIKNLFVFAGLILFSIVLYSISVKIICPPIKDSGYLLSFTSGNSNNMISMFFDIWINNLKGSFYYGEKLFIIVPLISVILLIRFFIEKKYFILKLLVLFFLILSPFLVSLFISNGYHPPRIYVTTGIIFAFLIVFFIKSFNINKYNYITSTFISLIIICNIYFITNLFYTCNKIYLYDKRNSEKMYDLILKKYPNFETTEKVVYFYGFFDFEYHQKFRLDKSEIFGGSIFHWGEADNYRVNNFFKLSNIGDFNMINKEQYDSVKDSISNMAVWPNEESIKMINGVVIVKLGDKKGAKLYFE